MTEPPLTNAPLPAVREGDRWRFAVTGRLGGTRHEESRRVIAVTADRIVCEVESTDAHAARGRFFYTRQWNLLRRPAPVPAGATAEEIEAAGDWRWQPYYPQYDFPLLPGKLWRGVARASNRATGTTNLHRYEARVLAARSVDTPAGRFAALPVRYVADVATEGDAPARLWRNEETLYYAPAVNHFVRAEQRVVDPAGQPARDAVHELLAYEPAA